MQPVRLRDSQQMQKVLQHVGCMRCVAEVFARQMDFNVRCQILQAMAQQSPYMRGIIVGRLDQAWPP